MKSRIVIIGKIPPPLGGVTIHVARLLALMHKEGIAVAFLSLSKAFPLQMLNFFHKGDIVHLHTSNSFLRFMLSLYCLVWKIPLILTIHGNLGRFGWLGNLFDTLAVYMARVPVILNEESLCRAIKFNPHSVQISSFLPPLEIESIPEPMVADVKRMANDYRLLFCTSAYRLNYDSYGNEIYGILDLVKIFQALSAYALVISDLSGDYSSHFMKIGLKLPENVYIIDGQHPFIPVLKMCDVYIRATSTDGDSLALKEALFYRKPVIATNVVSRPKSCLLYNPKDSTALIELILEIDRNINTIKAEIEDVAEELSGWEKLKQLYSKF